MKKYIVILSIILLVLLSSCQLNTQIGCEGGVYEKNYEVYVRREGKIVNLVASEVFEDRISNFKILFFDESCELVGSFPIDSWYVRIK